MKRKVNKLFLFIAVTALLVTVNGMNKTSTVVPNDIHEIEVTVL